MGVVGGRKNTVKFWNQNDEVGGGSFQAREQLGQSQDTSLRITPIRAGSVVPMSLQCQ